MLRLPGGHAAAYNAQSIGIDVVWAILGGLAIGALHGILFAKVGIPSFVVTLAGLLIWSGVVLILTTEYSTAGTIRIQNDVVVGIAASGERVHRHADGVKHVHRAESEVRPDEPISRGIVNQKREPPSSRSS